MKLKKLIYSLPLAVILVAAASGCRKSQFIINKTVNDPTDSTVTYDVVLPAALHTSGAIMASSGSWGPIQNWLGFWSRSGTYAPNVIEETYEITTNFGNAVWNNCYDNNYDYNIVQSKANVAGATFYEGIARIMKAHNFQILVDVYGNVPYSQALKGSGNPTPAYDNGLAIYQSLLREIDAGIALIKNAVVAADNANKDIWKNDIVFGDPVNGTIGSVPAMKVRWAKFGNTLKLRMLIHAYAVGAINKATEIGIINTEGSGYLETDALVQPGYTTDKPMPFHANYKTDALGQTPANNVYYAANKWGIEYYQADGDPRRSRFYEAGTGGLIGVPYGLPPVTTNVRAVLAGIGPGLYKTSSSPQFLLTAAEAYFLRAEARQRGFITTGPTAQQLMESGILASMTYLVTSASPATNLANYLVFNAGYPDVDITAGPLAPGYPAGGIATIISQKWFALNGLNPLEVWSDYRRVPFSSVSTLAGASTTSFTYGTAGGFSAGPKISVAPQNTSRVIPVRYLYPQTEYNYNSANVGAQGAINQFTSRVFWDLN
ncbi:MAG: SusD/RagB family nutrient-binding outer membrane lipoprotein [Chitinophagaceae bacterium]|nr:SusD/RagB family nutrient-binding outer membrane lipoprotein [Chitinophagaceae bacterium]